MKNFILLIVALVFSARIILSQPCLPEGITFTTQAQINNFQNNYPNCTQILGYVKITLTNITSLNGLSVLTSIGGYLTITYNTSLTNLSGLENLTSIGGTLSIESNNVLTNINGLASLTSVGGSGLWINSNPVLTSLAGLENLTTVNGGNQGGYVSVHDNPLLNNLAGLEGLVSIEQDFTIVNNSSLTSLTEFESLSSIGGDLRIESNSSLNNIEGMGNLSTIGGNLFISWNNSLLNLTGLEGLTTIGEFLTIWNNSSLTDITGLQNLTSISGALTFLSNANLTSLSGLENLNGNSITNLSITYNNSLSTCDVQSICDFLVSPNGTIDIQNNAPGCNSPEEVEEACLTSIEEIKTGNGITIIPNPSNDKITIYAPANSGNTCLSIFTVNGEQIIEKQIQQPETQLDISALPRGMYFVRVQDEKMVEVTKVVNQ
jgi:hypothetical protein